MRIVLATDAWKPQTNGVVTTLEATAATCPSYPGRAMDGALRLDRGVCAERAAAFSWEAATAQFLAGLAPVPAALRATLAVSRSSVMIGRIAARLTARRLTE